MLNDPGGDQFVLCNTNPLEHKAVLLKYLYFLVNKRLAIPAATPTAAATVTLPIAASFSFRLSACSRDSILKG